MENSVVKHIENFLLGQTSLINLSEERVEWLAGGLLKYLQDKVGILLIPKDELERLVKDWNNNTPRAQRGRIGGNLIRTCADQLEKLIERHK